MIGCLCEVFYCPLAFNFIRILLSVDWLSCTPVAGQKLLESESKRLGPENPVLAVTQSGFPWRRACYLGWEVIDCPLCLLSGFREAGSGLGGEEERSGCIHYSLLTQPGWGGFRLRVLEQIFAQGMECSHEGAFHGGPCGILSTVLFCQQPAVM